MARPRKRHIQQELFKPRGGKRRGAGRKPKGKRAGSPHKKRPVLKRRFPVHVVLRVHRDMVSLRRRRMYSALRLATLAVAMRELHFKEEGAFRIVHLSIQRTHVHLIVEADHATALSRGMQSFQISAAKHLNREVSVGRAEQRRGTVFPDRFHQEIIKTPRQARHTLAYVLRNASHCTNSGRRVEFPTSWAETWLLRAAQRAVGYQRPRLEDFVWNRTPTITGADLIDFQVRHGSGLPEHLYS